MTLQIRRGIGYAPLGMLGDTVKALRLPQVIVGLPELASLLDLELSQTAMQDVTKDVPQRHRRRNRNSLRFACSLQDRERMLVGNHPSTWPARRQCAQQQAEKGSYQSKHAIAVKGAADMTCDWCLAPVTEVPCSRVRPHYLVPIQNQSTPTQADETKEHVGHCSAVVGHAASQPEP